MTTTIGQRIAHIRGEKSQAAFAAEIGVHKNSIGNYERGERTPDAEFLARLMKAGYSANWVISGIGPMRLGETGFVAEMPASYQVTKEEYAFIPLYDVEACAGYGGYVDQESVKQELPFRRDWFAKEVAANPAHVHLIYVRGDSMAPDLKDGEIVMVNTAMNGALVRDDIYVVRIDDTIAVKMLSRLPGGRVKVMSKNQDYGSFETDLENIHIIGQVIWHAGRV